MPFSVRYRTIMPVTQTLRQRRSARLNGSHRMVVMSVWFGCLGRFFTEVLGQTEVTSFGAYHFHTVDLPTVIAIVAAFLCVVQQGVDKRLLTVAVMVMSVLIVVNLVRGLQADAAQAQLWARSYLGLAMMLIVAVASGTQPPTESVRRAFGALALMLGLLALIRLVTTPTLFMIANVTDIDANDGGRVLSAPGAFMMALGSVWMWSDRLRSMKLLLSWRTTVPLILTTIMVLTRQGTANIAFMAGLFTIAIFEPSRTRVFRAASVVAVGIVGTLSITLILPMLSAGAEMSHRSDNLSTRQAVWNAVDRIWPLQDTATQFFGLPGGQIPLLFVNLASSTQLWQRQLHNMYYQMLIAIGYLGLACYTFILISVAITAFYLASIKSRAPAYPLAFVIMTAILGYSYDIKSEQIFGVVVAIWWTRPTYSRIFDSLAPSKLALPETSLA